MPCPKVSIGAPTSEIDFDRDGKHHGYVRVPWSSHRSAYGWLPVPIMSIRNGDGPRALLVGGNHGDEYEGMSIFIDLYRTLSPEDIEGQLIFMPAANAPAVYAGRRTSPLDPRRRGQPQPAVPGARARHTDGNHRLVHHQPVDRAGRCDLRSPLGRILQRSLAVVQDQADGGTRPRTRCRWSSCSSSARPLPWWATACTRRRSPARPCPGTSSTSARSSAARGGSPPGSASWAIRGSSAA